MCVKFEPPTIAVIYRMVPSASSTIQSSVSSHKRGYKKYVHEIVVDQMTQRTDLTQLCDSLCQRESLYLNTRIISRSQVSPPSKAKTVSVGARLT